jgi:dipeptidyl aminopeptidase/acylaminoacyl peptidase
MPQHKSYPIERYLNARMAYGPSFSADGQQIAFLTNITGMPQVWRIDLPGGPDDLRWPDQITFAPDRVMGAEYAPAPGDKRLIYSRDVGGNEKAQLFLLAEDGIETSLTTGHEEAMHLPGEWSRDGSRILFAANRRHAGLFDLYVQDLDGEARMIWQNENPGYLFGSRFAPDGQHAAVIHNMSSFNHALYEVNLTTGESRRLTPADKPARYVAFAYANDGSALYINTDYEADFLYVARLDLTTLAMTPIAQRDWDIDGIALSNDGRRLAYVVNVDGASELYLLDLTSSETSTAPIPDSPGVCEMLTFSPNDSLIAFTRTGATRTYDVFVWDLGGNRVYPVTQSSHGGLPTESFITPEVIHYPTFDINASGETRTIPAWLFKPGLPAGEKAPVIVYVHGGPEGQTRAIFMAILQYFLHNGYAVLAPNVRGSTGYGKAYSHLDDVRLRMDSVADLAHAAYWLKAQPDIDGDRIVVYGGSYGGFMVLAALTHYPDLWAAGVDIVGISSFVSFLKNTSDYRRAHREAEYGSLEHDSEWMESIAPINHVDRITAPLMVIHGANDPRVPLGEAEQLVEALKTRNVPVEFLVFDDEGHGLAKLKNKLVAYPAVVDFLRKHV